MSLPDYYPPPPRDVPIDLTAPTDAYRSQVALVLISLIVFLVLYLGIIVFAGLLTYWTLAWRVPTVLLPLKLLVLLPCVLLCVTLVKNLFKFDAAIKSFDVEIFPDEHPRLFDFIERLCDEVEAPRPYRVFINYDVNACVSYDRSLWHLFVPAPKNLTIGLSLVNAVNLTEFKALLAHEFGHLSQTSMKLAEYVRTALRILDNMVYGYDALDRLIDTWRGAPLVIAWPAWAVYGGITGVRIVLGGLLRTICWLDRAQSRHAEFHADLVAVSAAGSDAPVHLLYKCLFAEQCLHQVLDELDAARDCDLHTSDLFYHLDKAAEFLRRKAKNPRLGLPPELPNDPRQLTEVFKEDDEQQADMWATHPSNYDREENAKYDYVRSTFDERTAWLLFDGVTRLRERATLKFYRAVFRAPKELIVASPEEVHAFIAEERAETTYAPKYQGLYDQRGLLLGELDEIERLAVLARVDPPAIAALAQVHAGLYNVLVKHRAQLYNHRLDEHRRLIGLANGWDRPLTGDFEFRGCRHRVRDAKRLLRNVEGELDEDDQWLAELDQTVFRTYYQIALQIKPAWATELLRRYEFQIGLQRIWERLRRQQECVNLALAFLQTAGLKLHPDEFDDVVHTFREARRELKDALKLSESMIFPALANLPAGQPLRPFLFRKKLVSNVSRYDAALESKWIEKFVRQLNEVYNRANRLHFKSMGGILALQETIGAEALLRSEELPLVDVAAAPAVVGRRDAERLTQD